MTAAYTIEAAGVKAGETVPIHGGAGGVGLLAVKLANSLGATVIVTAAERNHALIRELGAIPVVCGDGLAERVRAATPEGVTAAIDTVGSDEDLDVSLELVADRARIVSITGTDRRFDTGIEMLGYGPGQDAGTEYRASVRPRLAEIAGAGDVRVLVARSFPLTDATRAHEFGQAGGRTGTIVLLP